MKITFNIEMTKKEIGSYSLNKIYAGIHWAKRKKQADYIHDLVGYTLVQQRIPQILFKKPVKVTLSFNSNLDIDNHAYLSKLIVDGMKGYLIKDDTKKYVVDIEQKFWKEDGILVEVEEV
jgi:hypothetical protein